MITSPSNPKVKFVRRLQAERRFRARKGAFVIEGTRWLSELVRFAPITPELVLYTEAWYGVTDQAALLAQLPAPALPVSNAVMTAMSDTESAPGILAVVPMPSIPLTPEPTLLLVLDEITDPGNLGTMLRSAAAAGVDGVLLSPGCVDAYNPKVVRGGMGAQLRLPILSLGWEEIAEQVSGMTVWLAAADGDVDYFAVDWRRPSALVIGSEAKGANKHAVELANRRVMIPMQRATESLNAAMAATVIMFEAARQRRATNESSVD